MTERSLALVRAMEEDLESYRKATVELVDAVRDQDEAGTERAVEARARCIERYGRSVDGWSALPVEERDDSLLQKTKWHRLRIDEEDAAVLELIRSLQEEIGAEISRLGQVRKVDRAYNPQSEEKSRIVNGEG